MTLINSFVQILLARSRCTLLKTATEEPLRPKRTDFWCNVVLSACVVVRNNIWSRISWSHILNSENMQREKESQVRSVPSNSNRVISILLKLLVLAEEGRRKKEMSLKNSQRKSVCLKWWVVPREWVTFLFFFRVPYSVTWMFLSSQE